MSSLRKIPTIGITSGDPDGVGLEIIGKALNDQSIKGLFRPILFADPIYLKNDKIKRYFDVLDLDIHPCIPEASQSPALAAYKSIETAIEQALAGTIDSIVTAPINKEAFIQAGCPYKDHTTMLTALTKSPSTNMVFYTPSLKVVLATVHIPFTSIPSELTEAQLSKSLENALYYATLIGIDNPKIALAGLNPHAGENGLMGTEEQNLLTPFVKQKQAEGLPIEGPFPPDTLFSRAHRGEFDIVIALYHDQGLIPVKLIGFETAVNITLGLPFLRTSPDHGTAFEIAYQDKASHKSFLSALNFAIQYGGKARELAGKRTPHGT